MVTLEQLQDGIVLPIDKPRQWTSFQAVNKVKAVVRNTYGLKKFKIGHAGTLDPLATGLLLVCIGKATKTIPQLQDGDKVYTGTLVLGATTPCYDLERPVDHFYPYEHITAQLLNETVRQFTGTIIQVPPMFSAVKIDGQRAYEYARTSTASRSPPSARALYVTLLLPPIHRRPKTYPRKTSTSTRSAKSPPICRKPTSASTAAKAPTSAPWHATWAKPSAAAPSSPPSDAKASATTPSPTHSASTKSRPS